MWRLSESARALRYLLILIYLVSFVEHSILLNIAQLRMVVKQLRM